MGIRPFADGTLDKLKALLVVKGYLQEEEVDCEETFAPTTKYTSIQCGLQLAALGVYSKWILSLPFHMAT